ncbi:TRAP transporter large permease subunit [Desulfallas sp. Bu1-1]|uniref:TRAP transporter large permease subunit n=1 Tax=Desulfallas sp. Bu1-1 TaxID=2787620 RepID=UPI00189E73EC|nr:TRAP transporter large permease subunit [Desulfallas sp. Bu1-1]MBF7084518.1 TRAP transporter large permease subunit [Desulfallas sp. Bu1-1]
MNNLAIKKLANKNIFTTSVDSLSAVAGSVAGYAMLFVAFIMVYEIIARIFFTPTLWVNEISCYILVWFGFLASAYGLKEGSHINVDILVYRMSPRIRNAFEIVGFTFCLGYSLLLLVYSWDMFSDGFTMNERSSTVLMFPMYLVYLGLVIGSALLMMQSLKMLINRISLAVGGTLETGKGLLNNVWVIIPVFILLLAAGLGIYQVSPGLSIVITLVVFLLAGIPVFTCLGLVGSLGLFLLMGADMGLSQIGMVSVKSLDSFTLLAIPLYILAGQILMAGGIGKELFMFCSRWIGHLSGGTMAATIAACAIFAAISGSSVATAATIGIIAIPEILKRNYERTHAYGVVAAGGTLGILIPPSASMIIYSSITGESTGALFMGGLIPGFMLALMFIVFAVAICLKSGHYKKEEPCGLSERLGSFKEAIWALLAPVIIIGGIYTGIFTPTEAAAVTVIYALAVSLLRGKIKLNDLGQVMSGGTCSSTMILMIVVGAMILGTVVTFLQIPQNVCNFVGNLSIPVWLIIVLLSITFMILGMFLEVVSILLITMPIVYPLITNLGINGLWFGVYITLLMEMAMITPPVGLNLYVIQGVARAPIEDVIKGAWPYMVLLLFGLFILALFPGLALWLPGTMGLGGR